jgi:16S rRNA (guanine(966)-N(2))-methyltransferase RsmD
MRVIGGEFRSRRLKSIPGLATRPTPDRLRETLFDILGAQVEGTVFLDAYAGTGAVGIEALSRGAARAIFIEKSRNAAKVLRENLVSLGLRALRLVVPGTVVSSMAASRPT